MDTSFLISPVKLEKKCLFGAYSLEVYNSVFDMTKKNIPLSIDTPGQ